MVTTMTKNLSSIGLMLTALFAASAVQAQVFKDPALEALHLADNYAELGRVGTARAAADASDADARAAMLAEAQLLREQRDFAGAATVLKAATERFAGDTDLIYEQAMMSEKLGRFDEMEALLAKRPTVLAMVESVS